ncbi:hypothetical protein ABPG72_010211 [Tetrahymena utriculariae]
MKKFLKGFEKPSKKQFIYLLIFRIINAYLLRTYYAADEYWQSTEIAHKDVFGYGYQSWEWTREAPLRSPLYVFIFSSMYSILKYTHLDFPILVAYLPKLIAATQAATFDYFLLKIVYVYFGQIHVLPALILHLTNWYSLFAIPRLIFNVLEMTLFAITLYFYKLSITKKFKTFDYISRIVAIINFIAKPTSIIPLTFIWPYRLFTMPGKIKDKIEYFFLNVFTVVAMIVSSLLVDVLYYKRFTWTVYNFFEFNFLEAGSSIYGTHHKLWYVTECIPYLLLGSVVFFVIGLIKYISDQLNKRAGGLDLIILMIYFIFVLSLSAHKEDRFLLPLWPLFMLFTCYGFVSLKSSRYLKYLLFISIISNICLFAFMGIYHQRGAFSVVDSLRHQGDKVQSVYFFTECHQTPYYSFVHKNIYMDFPDCKPENRIKGSDSNKLFKYPQQYIKDIIENQSPSHIIILNHFINDQKVANTLDEHGYQKIAEYGHAMFIDSPVGQINDVSLILMEKRNS